MKAPEVLKETADYIILNKPAGVLSIPDREQSAVSLKDMLIRQFGQIFTVHRLDRDTSGVIIFAKNENAHRYLSQQFEARTTEKYYHGLVTGRVYSEEGLIDEAIGEHPSKKGVMTVVRKGKPSLTAYRLLQAFPQFSWMEFRIMTGRTHQIRVHMKHFGHPIACDPVYGDGQPVFLSALKKNYKLGKNELEEKPLLARLALHASKLVFEAPGGEIVSIEAPLPKDLKAVLQQLGKQEIAR
ncbi:RluA family pseudouridine synthase [Flavihumibacter petaseus]|uniref:Pseudouridine synthase n=1 Tax=Flavihumibacter petaseus NBRC 106054 TaxID=1220578 RepID=A0A0E9MVL2_9BACT|nr:RluA family pseudouridine synthase [Flavihumibacter petaseus]GAO41523.1 putative 23S rRNA pseudouridine synthase [Flavihumibacter petaseus NBRC 106054]